MMAKLYWRVKLNGKWTWRSAKVVSDNYADHYVLAHKMEEEE